VTETASEKHAVRDTVWTKIDTEREREREREQRAIATDSEAKEDVLAHSQMGSFILSERAAW